MAALSSRKSGVIICYVTKIPQRDLTQGRFGGQPKAQ